MTTDPRDNLWNYSFETYYNSYFEELLSDKLIKQWARIDIGVKILVALTATGSAVTGWTLWQKPEFKEIWAAISGIAAVAGIISTTVQFGNFIKDHTKANKEFAVIRNELENFRYGLNQDPQFDVKVKDAEFMKLKKKYEDCCTNNSNTDWTVTDRLRNKVQLELNRIIQNQINA